MSMSTIGRSSGISQIEGALGDIGPARGVRGFPNCGTTNASFPRGACFQSCGSPIGGAEWIYSAPKGGIGQMDERRQESRTTADWTGLCYLEGERNRVFRHCLIVDLSMSGFGVRASFPDGCDIVGERLCVELPAIGDSVNLRLAGVVKSADPTRTGSLRIGIEFDPLSMTERSMLTFIGATQREDVFSFS